MEPLVKWPGGKSRELARVQPLVPAGARLVEPFAGGAALFFAVEPERALLNDVDAQLVDFYTRIGAGNAATRAAFQALADTWDAARELALDAAPLLASAHIAGTLDPVYARHWVELIRHQADNAFSADQHFDAYATMTLRSKAARLVQLATRAPLSLADTETQLATGLLAGFYTFVRDAFEAPDADHDAAAWWFLREMCYGSMFRFNSAGHFNIPYGGASYNRKALRTKIALLFTPATQALMCNATLSNSDFRTFFTAYGVGAADDFVFLDPPYDSEFSGYANHPFGRAEQQALANWIADAQARALLIIKHTDFIAELYAPLAASGKVGLYAYDHRYGYNVRGRNARDVAHLAISYFELKPI